MLPLLILLGNLILVYSGAMELEQQLASMRTVSVRSIAILKVISHLSLLKLRVALGLVRIGF